MTAMTSLRPERLRQAAVEGLSAEPELSHLSDEEIGLLRKLLSGVEERQSGPGQMTAIGTDTPLGSSLADAEAEPTADGDSDAAGIADNRDA
jgi:hypothetical protein